MSLGVHGPCLVPCGELLCKPDTEPREVSGACRLVAEVQEQVHLFDGKYRCREGLQGTMGCGWLNCDRRRTAHIDHVPNCVHSLSLLLLHVHICTCISPNAA